MRDPSDWDLEDDPSWDDDPEAGPPFPDDPDEESGYSEK